MMVVFELTLCRKLTGHRLHSALSSNRFLEEGKIRTEITDTSGENSLNVREFHPAVRKIHS
jgi:hypothetical protein